MLASFGCLLARGNPLADSSRFHPTALNRLEIRAGLEQRGPVLPRLPIDLRVVISNPETRDLIIPRPTVSHRDEPHSTLEISYARATGAPTHVEWVAPNYSPMKEGLTPERPQLMRLRGKQSVSIVVPVSYEWRGMEPTPVVTPGKLRLWVRLCSLRRTPRGEWEVDRTRGRSSAPISLTVVTPSGAEARALAELAAIERPWLLALPRSGVGWIPPENKAWLRRFAETHAGTAYAERARLLAGR